MKRLLSLLLIPATAFAIGRVQNEDVKSLADIQSSVLSTTGNLSSGSPCIDSPASTTRLATGQFIYDGTTPARIPAGTTIAGLPGTCTVGQIQMSANAASNATGDTINFGGQASQLINDSKLWITGGSLNKQFSLSIADGSFFNKASSLTTKGDLLGFNGTATTRSGVGSDGSILTADSTAATGWKWGAPASTTDQPLNLTNVGLTATPTAGSMVVVLNAKDGTTLSPSNKATIAFRNITSFSTSASYTNVDITAAAAITIPSGATLGFRGNGSPDAVWVYAMNDGGAIDLCVMGTKYIPSNATNSGIPQAVISTGATSKVTLYCSQVHTGVKATRLVGRINVVNSPPSTWGTPLAITVDPVGSTPTYVIFTAGGPTTFTVPPGVTQIDISACGGGGGGGAGMRGGDAAGGGGAGSAMFQSPGHIIAYSGNTVSMSIGGGGAGGTVTPNDGSGCVAGGSGGGGGTTSVSMNGLNILTIIGGGGGNGGGTTVSCGAGPGAGSSGFNANGFTSAGGAGCANCGTAASGSAGYLSNANAGAGGSGTAARGQGGGGGGGGGAALYNLSIGGNGGAYPAAGNGGGLCSGGGGGSSGSPNSGDGAHPGGAGGSGAVVITWISP